MLVILIGRREAALMFNWKMDVQLEK